MVTPDFQPDHHQNSTMQQRLERHEEASSLSPWMTPENVNIHSYNHKEN